MDLVDFILGADVEGRQAAHVGLAASRHRHVELLLLVRQEVADVFVVYLHGADLRADERVE